MFDRSYGAQLGAKAVELLLEGHNNAMSTLQYSLTKGFQVDGYDANRFRDRWGYIHARRMDPLLYDLKLMQPSPLGIDYLLPIFTEAIGGDDMEQSALGAGGCQSFACALGDQVEQGNHKLGLLQIANAHDAEWLS